MRQHFVKLPWVKKFSAYEKRMKNHEFKLIDFIELFSVKLYSKTVDISLNRLGAYLFKDSELSDIHTNLYLFDDSPPFNMLPKALCGECDELVRSSPYGDMICLFRIWLNTLDVRLTDSIFESDLDVEHTVIPESEIRNYICKYVRDETGLSVG